jgi:hypothetical protein
MEYEEKELRVRNKVHTFRTPICKCGDIFLDGFKGVVTCLHMLFVGVPVRRFGIEPGVVHFKCCRRHDAIRLLGQVGWISV